MSDHVAFDPNTEVRGFLILNTALALGKGVEHILAKHGLGEVTPDGWYPQQKWLDALQEIVEKYPFDLVNVGIKIATQMPLPSEIQTLNQFLPLVQQFREAYHRNGTVGTMLAKFVGPNQIDVTVTTPYPADLTFGVIYGYLKRFLSANRHYEIEVVKVNAKGAHYQITW